MRIAVNGRFLAAAQTGVQRFALEIARRLLPEADVVLLLPREVEVPAELGTVERVEGRLKGHAWEQVELSDMVRRAGAEVCLNLANAVPAAGGPHAVVLHDSIVFDHPEWFGARYGLWHRRVLLPAARRAGAVGSLSRDAADRVARVLARPAHEIVVIPQGAAPFDHPASDGAVAQARRRLRIEGPYLLTLGAGDPRKNVGFLEELVAHWPSDGASQPPTLVIVGDAAARVFAASTPRKSSQASVIRVGRVDDETLRALYSGAAAFCFPSLAEGFGRPPLEALACGAPVLAAPYGPAREVLRYAAEILPLERDAWLGSLRRLVQQGPPPGFAEKAGAVVGAHRWEDGVQATLELCARAAGASPRAAGRAERPRAPAGSSAADPLPTPAEPV
jgi:glycosyltransferase involved in cell wall biosynthesis